MPRPASPRRGRTVERGFALVIVLAGIAVMMIMMGAGVSTWRYIMQDDREQELFFRGDQIAGAIERYQKKNGNTFPVSLEVMVQGKYLRRAYKDPMTKDGKWRLVRPGEAVPASGTGAPGASPRPGSSPSPSPSPSPSSGLSGGTGTSLGAIAGVASRSQETSLRLFNGKTRYDQWIFLAGQQRTLGPNKGLKPGSGGLLGASPRPSPTPRR
jgi:type II secretory pathway pseudopilin PulG